MDTISINYNPDLEEDDGSCEYAGTGGNVTIVEFPKHHGADTRPYHAYLKFNTQEFPGSNPSSYDLDILADFSSQSICLYRHRYSVVFSLLFGKALLAKTSSRKISSLILSKPMALKIRPNKRS